MSRHDGHVATRAWQFVRKHQARQPGLSALVIISLSAAMYVFAMPPWGILPLAFLALVPVMLGVIGAGRRTAALTAYGFGLVTFLILIYWLLYVTIAGWMALAAYLALYPLAFALLLRWTYARLRWPVTLLAPILWTALEYVRAVLLSGFPWFLIGHATSDFLPLMQMADLTGVYGISFVIVMVNGLFVDLALRRPHRGRIVALTAVTLVAVMVYGGVRIRTYTLTPGPRVALVQGNIPMDLKHSSQPGESFNILAKHLRLSLQDETRGADLLVWPETMMPVELNLAFDPLFSQLNLKPEAVRLFAEAVAAVKQMGEHTHGRLLIGAPAVEFDPAGRPLIYNSVMYFDAAGAYLGRYDKIHLVAFGEYTPLRDVFPFLTRFRPPQMGEDVRHGSNYRLFDLPWQGRTLRFATTVCYEDTEPRVVRRLAAAGADFLVNVSNDAWFGGSAELDEHLAIGRFRCVENRLGMARAYNSGISSIVDPLGDVTWLLEVDEEQRQVEGVLIGNVALSRTFSLYRVVGDVFAYACLLLAVGAVVTALRRPAASVDERREAAPRRRRSSAAETKP